MGKSSKSITLALIGSALLLSGCSHDEESEEQEQDQAQAQQENACGRGGRGLFIAPRIGGGMRRRRGRPRGASARAASGPRVRMAWGPEVTQESDGSAHHPGTTLAMLRVPTEPRADWRKIVESQGLLFHSIDGEPYWDESAYYLFEAGEVDADRGGHRRSSTRCAWRPSSTSSTRAGSPSSASPRRSTPSSPGAGSATSTRSTAGSTSPSTAPARPSCSNTTPTPRPPSWKPR